VNELIQTGASFFSISVPAAETLYFVFISATLFQYLTESWLGRLNRATWHDTARQKEAREVLGITTEDMNKSLAYAEDRFRFDAIQSAAELSVFMGFLVFGGFGWVDRLSGSIAAQLPSFLSGPVFHALLFFAIIGLLRTAYSIPWGWYRVFRIEERHGFNRQTTGGFLGDLAKGLLLGSVLGGIILSLLVWFILSAGQFWWLYAFLALTGFSLLVSWAYPVLIAPLFNKFHALEPGSLRDGIDQLAQKIGFATNGIFVMDASRRSSHGNAYFTGVFGKKRIVLFDTLVKDLSASQVIAVLAHELGHFKLHHVRKGLILSIISSFIMFYLLGLLLPYREFYQAFRFDGFSAHAALVVFPAWAGIAGFCFQPLGTWISRRHEFEADRFAHAALGAADDLVNALRVLREKSSAMPFAHWLYSTWYYSHPPMIERIRALRSLGS
jgi:STE24 endopeptidase